jgi:hypothetical protein
MNSTLGYCSPSIAAALLDSMPGSNEPLWDQIAKALADINAQQAHLNS